MKITILDSIMHGPLKPWLMKPNANDRFVRLLAKVMGTTPIVAFQLQVQLETLLQDYPTLVKYLREEKLPDQSLPLMEHFYEMNIPQHKNAFQQFYYLVYMQETLRYFNTFVIKVDEILWDEDKVFQIDKALAAIRVLTIQINEVIKEYDQNSPENENIHYALSVARFMLIVLYFEIQDYYSYLMENTITPKFFFQNYLHTAYDNAILKYSPIYYENFFWKMYHSNAFQIDIALSFLKKIKGSHLNKNLWLLARYENGIFLFQNGYSEKTVFNDFSLDGGEKIFNEKKQEWLIVLDGLNTGYKRINFINELLDQLEYVNDNINNKKSIPSRLYRFLLQQKEVYSNQLDVTFKSDISLYQNQTISLEANFVETKPEDAPHSQNPTAENSTQKIAAKKSKMPESELNSKFQFGFREKRDPKKVEALKDCVLSLDRSINLLNEDDDNLNRLIELFLSPQIFPGTQRINIGCETAQFKYVINKLEPYFYNLNQKSIGWSQCFFSKKGNVINAQNLYSSNAENPKLKKEMDDIFREFL
ncbi:MAG: hypothetical protein M9898_12270 [Chitinophagaceae bacterium]|nr:hypothetical protein [Chitinophagaceae bacterium]